MLRRRLHLRSERLRPQSNEIGARRSSLGQAPEGVAVQGRLVQRLEGLVRRLPGMNYTN